MDKIVRSVRDSILEIDKIKNNDGIISTGFNDLDQILGGGLYPKTFNVIASASHFGKTTFALQLAHNIAALGKRVVFISFLFTPTELTQRLISLYAGFSYINGKVSDISTTKERLNRLDLSFVYLNPLVSVKTIDGIIKEMGNPDVIFIDDICYVFSGKREITPVGDDGKSFRISYKTDYQDSFYVSIEEHFEITEWVPWNLRCIASHCNASIVVTKNISETPGIFPDLTGFDSSSHLDLVEVGEMIMVISRETFYVRNNENINNATVTVAKNNYGGLGVANLLWDKRFNGFCPVTSEQMKINNNRFKGQ